MISISGTIYARIFDSIFSGGSREYIFDAQSVSYTHTITASRGFESADITILVNPAYVEDWIRNGICRHVVVYSVGGEIVWEGFIDQISISIGTVVVNIGPIVDIGNRVTCIYTPIIDETTDPPVKGAKMETTIAEDSASQAKYGIREAIVSVGDVLEDPITGTNDAEEIRDTYLAEYKEPFVTSELSLGGDSGSIEIKLSCLGYFHYLSAYAYNQTTSIVSTQAHTKINSVLDADPNNLFASTNADIDYNPILVPAYEDENRLAVDVLEGIISMGDASGNRWTFGVYGDRKVYYKQIESTITYAYSMYRNPNFITNQEETTSYDLWMIRPAHWLILSDLTVDPPPSSNYRTDRRMIFIEQVTFTAPDSISISGERVGTVEQKINRLGIGGML